MSSSFSESGTYSEKFTKKIAKAKPKPTNNRMSINLCEDSRVEDNGPTRKTTPVKDDRMSLSNTSDSPSNEDSKGYQAKDKSHAVMTPTYNSNETTGTDVALGENSKATSNCGRSTMMDAQLSHIANATVISSPPNTAQPTSASNKSCNFWFINFGGTNVYTADMASFEKNKLAESGPINFLVSREVFLSKVQSATR